MPECSDGMGWPPSQPNFIFNSFYRGQFIRDWLINEWSVKTREKRKRFYAEHLPSVPNPSPDQGPWHMTHDTWHVTRNTWLRQFSLSDRFSRLMTCCRGGQTSLIRFHHLPTSTFRDVIFMKSSKHEVCIILLSRILSSQYCVKLNYGTGTHFVKLPSIL